MCSALREVLCQRTQKWKCCLVSECAFKGRSYRQKPECEKEILMMTLTDAITPGVEGDCTNATRAGIFCSNNALCQC